MGAVFLFFRIIIRNNCLSGERGEDDRPGNVAVTRARAARLLRYAETAVGATSRQ